MSRTTTMSITYVRTAHSDRLQLRVNGRLVALGGSGHTRANHAEAEAVAILAAAAAPRGLHVVSVDMDYGSDRRRNVWTMRAVLGVGSAPVASEVGYPDADNSERLQSERVAARAAHRRARAEADIDDDRLAAADAVYAAALAAIYAAHSVADRERADARIPNERPTVAAPVVKDFLTAADEAHADACAEAAAGALSAMIEGYLDCALWASVPLSEDESADQSLTDLGYERANCCADTLTDARAACEGFVEAHGDALRAAFEVSGYTPSHAGHDLFLSRNGHGAGFFDHGEHPCWDVLQAAARGLGATEDVSENEDGTCTVR
jgi:hypothetical protein